MDRILIVGYGNADREDDGVAWHILTALAKHFGRAVPETLEEGMYPDGNRPDFMYSLQLAPEQAETIAQYDRVCFVDAHTGSVPEDLHIEALDPGFQTSPFTHHMTPQTCLSLAQSLYHHSPEATLVSVRGYRFGFSRELSEETKALAAKAVRRILMWTDVHQSRDI